ncbi:hypothetical protein [Bacillus nitratireducens]|nr:hypothetical protein [Bacillus nitratireducens]
MASDKGWQGAIPCPTYINGYFTTYRMYVCSIIDTYRNGGETNDDQ